MIVMELNEVFNDAESINVYNVGEKTSYSAGEDKYNKILSGWNNMISEARLMPAFGVSINRETVKDLQNGRWVEFEFDCEIEAEGMPFEKLLVRVDASYYGFNVIRYNSKTGYDGRCYYYDLVNKNMSAFNDVLGNL